jgi:hypothetical protein
MTSRGHCHEPTTAIAGRFSLVLELAPQLHSVATRRFLSPLVNSPVDRAAATSSSRRTSPELGRSQRDRGRGPERSRGALRGARGAAHSGGAGGPARGDGGRRRSRRSGADAGTHTRAAAATPTRRPRSTCFASPLAASSNTGTRRSNRRRRASGSRDPAMRLSESRLKFAQHVRAPTRA